MRYDSIMTLPQPAGISLDESDRETYPRRVARSYEKSSTEGGNINADLAAC